jgi:hypothetical protein
MSNSDIIIIFKPELKENLILRQIYYHNTSSNINNETMDITTLYPVNLAVIQQFVNDSQIRKVLADTSFYH